MEQWVLYSIFTLISWGLWGFVLKFAYDGVPWQKVYFIAATTSFAVSVIVFLSSKVELVWSRNLIFAALAGLAGAAGYIFFIQAIRYGKVSVVVPLTALYPAVTAILGVALLGEKLSLSKALGIALALVAAVLLAR